MSNEAMSEEVKIEQLSDLFQRHQRDGLDTVYLFLRIYLNASFYRLNKVKQFAVQELFIQLDEISRMVIAKILVFDKGDSMPKRANP